MTVGRRRVISPRRSTIPTPLPRVLRIRVLAATQKEGAALEAVVDTVQVGTATL